MLGRLASRRMRAAALTCSTPLISSTPTFRRPIVGLSMSNTIRAIAAPITARSTRWPSSPPIVAPTSRTIEFAPQGGPERRDRRAVDRRHRVQAELRHRHEGAGISGRHRVVRVACLDRFDRLPHRRNPPSRPEGLARFVGHLDRDAGVKHARSFGELRRERREAGPPHARRRRSKSAGPDGARERWLRPTGQREGRCRPPSRQALCGYRSPFPRPNAPRAVVRATPGAAGQ